MSFVTFIVISILYVVIIIFVVILGSALHLGA